MAGNIDKLLAPKTLAELQKLEGQIRTKLSSNEPIDTDYWEHLLQSLLIYKARANLRKVTQSILESRLGGLRKQQAAEADAWISRLQARLHVGLQASEQSSTVVGVDVASRSMDHRHALDPEPLLRLRTEDKALGSMTLNEFSQSLVADRRKVLKLGYVPGQKRGNDSGSALEPSSKRQRTGEPQNVKTSAIFDREVARGLSDNEELLTTEIPVETKNKHTWPADARPRKPQYFNRSILGYEWNKYNQTHYDHDNPPPKVVQGYKFNVLYPDLLDKTRAPTYKIEREGGRRRGEVTAKAGEDDTCIIRFVAGAPYEDIAFKIVDREWDYSAKRERGFRSSFDKGILQLHFQFKKVCTERRAVYGTFILTRSTDLLPQVIGLMVDICSWRTIAVHDRGCLWHAFLWRQTSMFRQKHISLNLYLYLTQSHPVTSSKCNIVARSTQSAKDRVQVEPDVTRATDWVYAFYRCGGIDRQHCSCNLSTKLDFIYHHTVQDMDALTRRAHNRAQPGCQSTWWHLIRVDNGAAVTPLSVVATSRSIFLDTAAVRHTVL